MKFANISILWGVKGLLCLGICLGAFSAWAEDPLPASSEEVDRYARIVVSVHVDNNAYETRRTGISQAEEDAVFVWLTAELGWLDAQAEQYFLKRLDDYVSNTTVLSEVALVRGGELDVEVLLDTATLRFDAAHLLFPRRKTPVPTLFLMGQYIEEGTGYSVQPYEIGPRMLIDVFEKYGFNLYPDTAYTQRFTDAELIRFMQEGEKGALRFARALDAEIIVFGETKSMSSASDAKGPSKVRGTADIFVIRVADGQVLERIKTDALVEGSDIVAAGKMAIEDAVYKAQNRVLVAAALGSLKEPERSWVRVTIEGDNVKNFSDSLTDYLSGLDSIESLELLHSGRDSLIYSVDFSGKLSALVDVIHLEPIKIVDTEMTFRLTGL
jgi:hypothetical protein